MTFWTTLSPSLLGGRAGGVRSLPHGREPLEDPRGSCPRRSLRSPQAGCKHPVWPPAQPQPAPPPKNSFDDHIKQASQGRRLLRTERSFKSSPITSLLQTRQEGGGCGAVMRAVWKPVFSKFGLGVPASDLQCGHACVRRTPAARCPPPPPPGKARFAPSSGARLPWRPWKTSGHWGPRTEGGRARVCSFRQRGVAPVRAHEDPVLSWREQWGGTAPGRSPGL